jgi:DNA polymerase
MLHLDLETRSPVDLKRHGVYTYAAHQDTGIWLAAFAFGTDEPALWVEGEPVPERVADYLRGGGLVAAYNAAFERNLWPILVRRHGWPDVPLAQWRCTMAQCAAFGLSASLDAAAEAFGLEVRKDKEGAALMRKMCAPLGYVDGRPVWFGGKENIRRLGEYCQQDVRVEAALSHRIPRVIDSEVEVYHLDQRINDRGVLVDRRLAEQAVKMAGAAAKLLDEEIAGATGGTVTAVTQVQSLRKWIATQGVQVESLAKRAVTEVLADDSLAPEVRRAVQARQEGGKSSVAKFQALLNFAGTDGRVRGMLLYHGAATGRWAGRGPQPQNFPRPDVKDAEQYIPLVQAGDFERLAMLRPIPSLLASLLRACLMAAPGRRLMAADYSAIEARVLAWLAGQSDLLADFRAGVDPYKRMATHIYGRELADVSGSQRQAGKVAILGLGYGMGHAKFVDYAAGLGVFLEPEECGRIVRTYRARNSRITAFWWDLEGGARQALTERSAVRVGRAMFEPRGDKLRMVIPSGRSIWYHNVALTGSFPKSIEADVWSSKTKSWQRRCLFGGLLTENLVQAVARDLMADAMLRLDANGYPVVLTVHDEVVSEVPLGKGSVPEFVGLMTELPDWALGCPVTAEAWEGARYRK